MSEKNDKQKGARRNAAVTLRDVAHEAGVGVSTVSAVLAEKDWCYASEATRQRIHDAARRLRYVPNHMARAMKGLSTRTIGVIASPFASGIQFEMLREMAELLWERGYYVLTIYGHKGTIDREHVHALVGRGLDGVIVKPSELEGSVEENIPDHLPCVRFDHANPTHESHYIDRYAGSLEAARHLITDHGHRRILYVTKARHKTLEPKLRGVTDALAEADLPWYEDDLIDETEHPEYVDVVVERIRAFGITAVMSSSDELAVELVNRLPARGFDVPGKVAVVGFDGDPKICSAVRPSLTTVRQPVETMAANIVEHLMSTLPDGPTVESPGPVVIPSVLKIGRSCGCSNVESIVHLDSTSSKNGYMAGPDELGS